MTILIAIPAPRRTAAFTMVEIAIAVAIIAFALVAIIGILPAGLQVQKDNRQDTLIGQDGSYFMEAIRNGAADTNTTGDFPAYVESIASPAIPGGSRSNFTSGAEVIGLLSTPGVTNTAVVRAIAGALSDKRFETTDLAFRYQLQVQILPFDPPLPFNSPIPPEDAFLRAKLHEIRLLFRWPILPNGNLGNGRQVLRSMISGDFQTVTNGATFYYFLRP
jgi:type II secretory pathway pseudopilin PulG